MTVTVYGPIADQLGHALWHDHWMDENRAYRSTSVAADPGSSYARAQPASLPILVDHYGRARGRVVHLERQAGTLSAVGVIDDLDAAAELLAGPAWWSSSTERHRDGLRISELSLTRAPASVGLAPLQMLADDIESYTWKSRRPAHESPNLLTRANATATRWDRHRADVLLITDLDPIDTVAPVTRSRLEYRSAATGTVNRAERTIEVIAVPYNKLSTAASYRGRVVAEEFANHALHGEESKPDRIPVNRDHDLERLVGKVVRLDPYRPDGCHATLKIARSTLGDETLALAADDCLSASVGFYVKPGGEQWDTTNTRRRITKAGIEHIALVPDPAYRDAVVLDVRRTTPYFAPVRVR